MYSCAYLFFKVTDNRTDIIPCLVSTLASLENYREGSTVFIKEDNYIAY